MGYWTQREGALTTIQAAISPEHGKYFIPVGRLQEANAEALDEKFQDEFVAFTDKLLKDRGY